MDLGAALDKEMTEKRNRNRHIKSSERSFSGDSISERRRTLIRASAAAVPAIMTLRSGAAAAAGSFHACIARDAERAAIEIGPEDLVFGDDPTETEHDQWVRIVGKCGRKVVSLHGASTQQTTWYCLRNNNSATDWDDIDGWDCYTETGLLLPNNSPIPADAWDAATRFYCVNRDGIWECVEEGGTPLITTIPVTGIDAAKDVYLLVYVQSFDGTITGATYYPHITMITDQAAPITGSCLASVDPDFNILG